MARFYERWFDRPSQDIQIDAPTLQWIRENEPGRWRRLASATQRNARRIQQLGWLTILVGVVRLALSLRIAARVGNGNVPEWSFVLSGLWAGLLIGIGFGGVLLAGNAHLLAMLKGEIRQRDS